MGNGALWIYSCGLYSAPSAWSAPDDTEVEAAGEMGVGVVWGAWSYDRSVGAELRRWLVVVGLVWVSFCGCLRRRARKHLLIPSNLSASAAPALRNGLPPLAHAARPSNQRGSAAALGFIGDVMCQLGPERRSLPPLSEMRWRKNGDPPHDESQFDPRRLVSITAFNAAYIGGFLHFLYQTHPIAVSAVTHVCKSG